jgi:hypothetical protein
MRLSLMKAAHATLAGTAYRKSGYLARFSRDVDSANPSSGLSLSNPASTEATTLRFVIPTEAQRSGGTCGAPFPLPRTRVPHTPGFPVKGRWGDSLHAAFLNESRTRDTGWHCVQEIRVSRSFFARSGIPRTPPLDSLCPIPPQPKQPPSDLSSRPKRSEVEGPAVRLSPQQLPPELVVGENFWNLVLAHTV